MTSPVLPLDVFDEIFNRLINETSTLKSCSLVCRSFRRRAQKILFDFTAVTLVHTKDDKPNNLVLIVEQAPHLIEYIQELQIFGNSIYWTLDDDRNTTDLANALGIFSRKGETFPINLRSLRLHGLLWHLIPPGLEDALVLLMAIHSLRDITLNHFMGCPANLVQNLPPLLKHLSLKDTTFSSLPTNRNEPPKLDSLTIRIRFILTEESCLFESPSDAVERIVNVSRLKTFQGDDCNVYTMPAIERILKPTSNSLKHLILS